MRSAYSAAALVVACLALGACASVRKPDVRLPAAFEAPQGAAPAGAIALDRWWTAYEDPELSALIDQALIANPDARSAAARLREARATRASALLQTLPTGSVSASDKETHTHQLAGTAIDFPGFSTSGTTEAQAANFNVSWDVDLFGRTLAARRALNGDVAAARFDYEAARASLAAQVADAYFQVRGLAIQLADARETVRITQGLFDTATRRGQIGVAATSDADRVAGDLAQARAQAQGLEAELQVERRTLLVLAGRIAEPTVNVKAEPAVGVIPQIPASVPSALLGRRPDVREAQARIASASGRRDADALALLPTFTLTPGIGWAKNSQPGFSSTTQNWSLGGAITQPILAIPHLLQDLKAADARTEQAVIAYEKAVQTAFSEAEASLVRLDADRRRVALLADGEARARRGYEASQIGYARGLTDLQTALQAEQSWRATRSQLTAAQVQALRRSVQAYKAVGGGWPAERFPSEKQAR
jgi:NodT family efflux transporter outer membrane factor (OMF) lipoprotein